MQKRGCFSTIIHATAPLSYTFKDTEEKKKERKEKKKLETRNWN